MQTINRDSEKESNSAAVNRPHIPKENLLPSEQGLVIYWHMGRRRKAKATVAITEKKNCIVIQIYFILRKVIFYVHTLFLLFI